MVFDVLEKNGQSLLELPYEERVKHIPDVSSSKILTNVEAKEFRIPQ